MAALVTTGHTGTPAGGAYEVRAATAAPFGDVLERTRAALAAEGFGVLTEIDVQATLRAKLGVEREAYVILGACDPRLAHPALQEEPGLGVLLPCNVVVRREGGLTVVGAVDARAMLGVVGNPALDRVAEQVTARLTRAVEAAAA